MLKFFSLVGLLSLIQTSFAQNQPIARLYSSRGCTGSSVAMPAGNFVNDLTEIGFNNRAYSASIRGAWQFFDLVNYNDARDSRREYHFKLAEQCVDLSGGYPSSIRFAGHGADYRVDTINFYEYPDFQGHREYAGGDISNMALRYRISSFIVTGSAVWTIYDEPNYAGNSLCVRPKPNLEPAFFYDTQKANPSFPHGSIASARRGCFGSQYVTINSDVHNETSFHGKSSTSKIAFFPETIENK